MTTEVLSGQVPSWTRGDRLRKALSHAGVSVGEMADYLDVSRQSIGNWVNDRIAPSKQTLRLWAMRCGVPLVWLETGQAPADPPGPEGLYTTRDSNPEPIDWESGEPTPVEETPAENVYPLFPAAVQEVAA